MPTDYFARSIRNHLDKCTPSTTGELCIDIKLVYSNTNEYARKNNIPFLLTHIVLVFTTGCLQDSQFQKSRTKIFFIRLADNVLSNFTSRKGPQ